MRRWLALLFLPAIAWAMPEAPPLSATLEAHERGCGGDGEADTALRTRFEDGVAIFEQDIWLSLRQSIEPMNPVHVSRDGDTLTAVVDVQVAAVEPGHPVPACIRPIHVVLKVPGLAPGDYQLNLQRAPSP